MEYAAQYTQKLYATSSDITTFVSHVQHNCGTEFHVHATVDSMRTHACADEALIMNIKCL